MSQPTIEPRAATPVYGWRVPVLGDVPNAPSDITNLATDIETTVARDSGWRNISGLFVNGWTGTVFRTRRIGKQIFFSLDVATPATYNAVIATAIPTGWGVSSTNVGSNAFFPVAAQGNGQLANVMLTFNYASAAWVRMLPSGFGGTVTSGAIRVVSAGGYLTDDPWPANYPGTP